MRVLIVTSGSMGDVAPYTGLGARLRDAGHDVTLATHEPFAGTVAAAGLPFRPLPGDLRAILPQAHGQDGSRSGTGPRALAQLLRIARPLIAELGDGIAAAVEETRAEVLLLSTIVAPLGYQVAEAAGIPWAGVFLQPISPTGAFGSVLLGGQSIGALGNRLVTRAALTVSQSLYAGPISDLRARLGLPRQSMRELRARQELRCPTFHGFSPSVVPRPTDWPASHEVVGYWWPARPAGWQPPAALTDFLAAGPPPVFVGFGSMATGHGSRLAEPVLAALRSPEVRTAWRAATSPGTASSGSAFPVTGSPGTASVGTAAPGTASPGTAAPGSASPGTAAPGTASPGSGVRAVVQSGWAGLDVVSDDILTVGEVPHDWLFPRTAAVVHHSGAGTTAAGLRAGVPAVAVPVLADQPFWAARLHDLGAAPRPLPLPDLTADRLASALAQALGNPRHRARAAAMAGRLAAEDGTTRILSWLATLA